MKTIYLVACTRGKAPAPRPAESLYHSHWFAKARGYVTRHRGPKDLWFILSAKYGLVDPQHVIEPYEKTLVTMPEVERRAWADRVLERLLPRLKRQDHIIILAGARYRQFIEPALTDAGYHVEVPMRGLGIGKQLAFLTVRNSSSLF